MKVFKQPWFIILLLIVGLYTYQFYQSPSHFEVSFSSADASEETAAEGADLVKYAKANFTESFSTTQVKSFQFSTFHDVDLTFEVADVDKVNVNFVGEGRTFRNKGEQFSDWFHVAKRNGKLELKSYYKGDHLLSFKSLSELFNKKTERDQFKMIVQVPKSHKFQKVIIESPNGSNLFKELNTGKLNISGVSGDIKVEGGQARKIDLNTVSGSADIKMQSLGSISFNTVSGDLDVVAAEKTPKMSFNSVSGGLNMKLAKDAKIKVNFESLSGDLTNEFGLASDGKAVLNFHSLSGDAQITKL